MAYHFGVWLDGPALELALMTMDHGGDGEISYEEFLQWYNSSNFASLRLDDDVLEKRNLSAVIFKRYDVDSSGSLDREEFAAMHAEMLSEGVTDLSLEEVMRDIDGDNDGMVQFNEFSAWLDKYQ
jgi:Ca2+-binding EF-hand superfamily protein